MRCRTCRPLPEEVAKAADLLGRRWMLAILWASEKGYFKEYGIKVATETLDTAANSIALL